MRALDFFPAILILLNRLARKKGGDQSQTITLRQEIVGTTLSTSPRIKPRGVSF